VDCFVPLKRLNIVSIPLFALKSPHQSHLGTGLSAPQSRQEKRGTSSGVRVETMQTSPVRHVPTAAIWSGLWINDTVARQPQKPFLSFCDARRKTMQVSNQRRRDDSNEQGETYRAENATKNRRNTMIVVVCWYIKRVTNTTLTCY
jgi:hypothetical protein